MSATVVLKRGGRIIGGVFIALLVLLMLGCKVGPDYKRPAVDVPGNYRQALAPEIAPASSASNNASIADEQWPSVFQDSALQHLIEQALANNLDLRIAAQRVLQAQAQVGIAHSQQLSSISGGASYSALQIPSSLAGTKSDGTPANSFFRSGGPSASAAWNLDFWGLYRRQSEAARARSSGQRVGSASDPGDSDPECRRGLLCAAQARRTTRGYGKHHQCTRGISEAHTGS